MLNSGDFIRIIEGNIYSKIIESSILFKKYKIIRSYQKFPSEEVYSYYCKSIKKLPHPKDKLPTNVFIGDTIIVSKNYLIPEVIPPNFFQEIYTDVFSLYSEQEKQYLNTRSVSRELQIAEALDYKVEKNMYLNISLELTDTELSIEIEVGF